MGSAMRARRIEPLAAEYLELLRSPNPRRVFCVSPEIDVLPTGRIVVTDGLRGPGEREALPPEERRFLTNVRRGGSGADWIGYAMVSNDDGRTFQTSGKYPMLHQRLVRRRDGVARDEHGPVSGFRPLVERSEWTDVSPVDARAHRRYRVLLRGEGGRGGGESGAGNRVARDYSVGQARTRGSLPRWADGFHVIYDEPSERRRPFTETIC